MFKICLVEDEKDLNDLIMTYLQKENYEVINFYNGKDALNYVGNSVHLWILDIMLGDDTSGYDIIKKIREEDEFVPVIFTSARDQELDKIIGLELGSDDYITKPFSPKELVLRVNNIIKRAYASKNSVIHYENYTIDLNKRSLFDAHNEVDLTSLEFDLLALFVTNLNKTFGREEILGKVWGNDYFGSDRVVDDLIRRLRKKVKLNLKTVYGYGYRLI